MVHSLFGYALCGASLARIVEICFVLKEQRNADDAESAAYRRAEPSSMGQRAYARSPRAFSYLPAYLMVAAGIMFMSATDEEMRWADAQGIDGGTWGMIDFSWAFFVFFYTSVLVDKYTAWGGRCGQRNAASLTASTPESGVRGRGLDAYYPVASENPDAGASEQHAMTDGLEASTLRMQDFANQPREGVAQSPSTARPSPATKKAPGAKIANELHSSQKAIDEKRARAQRSTSSDLDRDLWTSHEDPFYDPFADADALTRA